MDPRAVVLKLRQLASDPDNQAYIAREPGCMQGLVRFLEDPAQDVVLVALQAVHFLATHPMNRAVLAAQPGLVQRLNRLAQRVDHPNLAHFATASLDAIREDEGASSIGARGRSFKPRHLFSTRVDICEIVDQGSVEIAQRMENAVLAVQGVVSITVQPGTSICSVYSVKAGLDAQVIDALHAAGFVNSQQIVAMPPQGPTHSAGGGPAASTISRIASDADDENKENYASNPNCESSGYLSADMFKARPGSLTMYADSIESTTLATRLAKEKQRQQARKQQQSSVKSMFSSITSLLW